MKKFIIIILCFTVLTCCKKSSLPQMVVAETFAFEKRIDTVYVTPSITQYFIKGTAEIDKSGKTINDAILWPVPELSTAVFNEHYSYPTIISAAPGVLIIKFMNSTKSSARVILFPENIKEELQLVYRHAYANHAKSFADTTFIRFIPAN